MIVGYARVSTDGQTLDAQEETLRASNADRVFSEKQSGAKTDREELRKAIASLRPGDVFIVTKLDRLARSTRDLFNVLAEITKAGASYKVLDNPMIDTTTPHGRLITGVLAVIAEFERDLIKSRCLEGIRRAKHQGIRFGRKPKLDNDQRYEALQRIQARESYASIARDYGVDRSTISRLADTIPAAPRT